MRTDFSAKLFFLCSFFTIIIFFYVSYRDFNTQSIVSAPNYKVLKENFRKINDTPVILAPPIKYILQWTSPINVPFVYMGVGSEGFVSRGCPYTNCIVTSDRNYLGNISKFDVIAFSGPEVIQMHNSRLPHVRSPKQKYAFASIESSHYYPVCSNRFDGYFNWTWTFRLDSEVRWGYMLIKDWKNNTVGPNKIMHWLSPDEMDSVSEELKKKLKTKTKAAAWFVSNCYDKSNRLLFAQKLKSELLKYKLQLDIYGKCGSMSCPRDKQDECNKILDKTYYFYLSFENSFSEDYVTEKLLYALQNNVVPIVFGGANYTRFVPDGAYLNARELGVKKLAAKMHDLIHDHEQYANYFKWKKYYSYHSRHESPETDEYCNFCAIVNDKKKVEETTVIKDFRKWWDSPKFC